MAAFTYEAINKIGKTIRGSVEAASQEDAITALQQQGLTVLYITAIGPAFAPKGKARRKMHRGVKGDDMVLYARQLATMIPAGIALSKALRILSMQIESKALLAANEDVIKSVEAGKTMREAFARHPKIFSRFWINLIETGEKSGQLAAVLNTIAAYLEEMASLKRKIITALTYPALLLGMVCLVTGFFVTFIIPAFTKIYAGMGISANLPLLTRVFMGLSDLVRRYMFVLFAMLFFAGFIFTRYVRTEAGRRQFDSFKLGIPVLGGLFRSTTTNDFTSSLATLIKSGVPLLGALEILERTLGNRAVASMLSAVRESVKEGKPMSEQLAKIEAFPPMVAQMVAVGEETGELSSMLERVAAFAKENTDAFVGRLTTVLEPLLIVIMAVVIGTLAIAMYLPMFQFVAVMK